MKTDDIVKKVRQSIVVLVIGALVALVPFYFTANAAIEHNRINISEQQQFLRSDNERLRQLELNGAVVSKEIEQIRESLKRIESKIDQIIEEER